MARPMRRARWEWCTGVHGEAGAAGGVRTRLAGAAGGQAQRRDGQAARRGQARRYLPSSATSPISVPVVATSTLSPRHHAWRDTGVLPRHGNRHDQKC